MFNRAIRDADRLVVSQMSALANCGRDAELVGVGVEHRHAETGAVAAVVIRGGVKVVAEIAGLEEAVVLLL